MKGEKTKDPRGPGFQGSSERSKKIEDLGFCFSFDVGRWTFDVGCSLGLLGSLSLLSSLGSRRKS